MRALPATTARTYLLLVGLAIIGVTLILRVGVSAFPERSGRGP